MKSKLLTVLGLTVLPLAACAQPDFSGNWVANVAESEQAVNTNYWFGRITGDPPGQPDLKIEQEGNTISVFEQDRVLTRYDYPAIYTADGQAHRVTDGGTGLAQVTITTSWDDDELVIESVKPWGSMPGNVTLESREIWRLSPGGDKLYITTTHSSPAKEVTYTRVYDRQD